MEKLEQADEALKLIAEREQEANLEYGGWAMLLNTFAEAEAEDAVHLGNALIDPVAKRMAELTGQRYGAPSIGPKLKTHSIQLADSDRDLDRLSVGTRDQLATLLRLSIAEALGSVLVLDDQLTQTDPGRMTWLRDQLRRSAASV